RFVREARLGAGAGLEGHREAELHELTDGLRRRRDAPLAGGDFLRDPDHHALPPLFSFVLPAVRSAFHAGPGRSRRADYPKSPLHADALRHHPVATVPGSQLRAPVASRHSAERSCSVAASRAGERARPPRTSTPRPFCRGWIGYTRAPATHP